MDSEREALGRVLHGSLVASNERSAFRVCWEAEAVVFLIELKGRFAPASSRMPVGVPARVVANAKQNGLLSAGEDPARVPEMNLPDSELPVEVLKERDLRYDLISELVDGSAALARLFGPGRGEILRLHALAKHVPVARLYQLLTRYWWFGCDREALTPLHALRGGRGKRRLTPAKRPGRRTATEILDIHRHLPSRRVDAEDDAKFRVALTSFYGKELLSLPETYSEMCRQLYPAPPRSRSRAPHVHPPTESQFLRHATRLITELGLRRKRAGRHEWANSMRSSTGSAMDIALGPTDIYDMDGVDLKCAAVTDDCYAHPFGKVGLILVVDRASSAIPGWHDFVGPEKWDHYRMALFWSFVDTRRHLDAIGGHPDYEDIAGLNVWGACNSVFVDRGPARSDASFYTLVKELKVDRAIADTNTPTAKPTVESVAGLFQRILRRLPGGYSRRQGERYEDEAADADLYAILPRPAIREVVAAAVAEHNAFADASKYLTREMARDGVEATPAAIFAWGKRQAQVQVARHLTEQQLYFRMLPCKNFVVHDDGIRHNTCSYSSTRLRDYRDRHLGRKCTVRASWDDVDPTRRYWEAPDGSLDVLEMKASQLRRFRGMSVEEVEVQRLRDLACAAKKSLERRSKAYVTRAQERVLAQHLGVKHSPAILGAKQSGKAIEQARHNAEMAELSRRFLDPDSHAVMPEPHPPSRYDESKSDEASLAEEVFASAPRLVRGT